MMIVLIGRAILIWVESAHCLEGWVCEVLLLLTDGFPPPFLFPGLLASTRWEGKRKRFYGWRRASERRLKVWDEPIRGFYKLTFFRIQEVPPSCLYLSYPFFS